MENRPGRNAPCPCGSGKKFKKCHGTIAAKPLANRVVGTILDFENKNRLVMTNDMLVNQLSRDALRIALSFDHLCLEEIRPMSYLMARLSLALLAGLRKATEEKDELRETCFHLLSNASHSFTAATTLLRSGFRLQPGILVRNILETLTAVICIFSDADAWRDFKADRFKPEKEIAVANKVIPVFGRAYGFFSEKFAHIRKGYGEPNFLIPYESLDEPLKANISFLKLSIWLIYVVAELVYLDVAKPMYWERLASNAYAFRPNEEGSEWINRLLDDTDIRPGETGAT
jgi:hypothetical protein